MVTCNKHPRKQDTISTAPSSQCQHEHMGSSVRAGRFKTGEGREEQSSVVSECYYGTGKIAGAMQPRPGAPGPV